eukprot:TRINITY_DN7042_c0_g2_i1.p1 TRINITY_DN7042_c0_g2~~TRINITY_DN7042_c0_g2_i1.p1  ORF type:complete len:861 (+),score=259.25 TRINITY_DN7042_c0_g2_i1:35-2617(+)
MKLSGAGFQGGFEQPMIGASPAPPGMIPLQVGEVADQDGQDDKEAKSDARYDSQFYKTRLCRFFQIGRCSRGNCKFAHGKQELRMFPDLRKTSMCRNIVTQGFCDDQSCSFAHNLDELRATDKFHKTTLCYFHLYGTCKLGEMCRHAHSKEELRILPGGAQPRPDGSSPDQGSQTFGGSSSASQGRAQGRQQRFSDAWTMQCQEEIQELRMQVMERQHLMQTMAPGPQLTAMNELQMKQLHQLQQLSQLDTMRRHPDINDQSEMPEQRRQPRQNRQMQRQMGMPMQPDPVVRQPDPSAQRRHDLDQQVQQLEQELQEKQLQQRQLQHLRLLQQLQEQQEKTLQQQREARLQKERAQLNQQRWQNMMQPMPFQEQDTSDSLRAFMQPDPEMQEENFLARPSGFENRDFGPSFLQEPDTDLGMPMYDGMQAQTFAHPQSRQPQRPQMQQHPPRAQQLPEMQPQRPQMQQHPPQAQQLPEMSQLWKRRGQSQDWPGDLPQQPLPQQPPPQPMAPMQATMQQMQQQEQHRAMVRQQQPQPMQHQATPQQQPMMQQTMPLQQPMMMQQPSEQSSMPQQPVRLQLVQPSSQDALQNPQQPMDSQQDVTSSKKELDLIRQQIMYHQRMQQKMQQEMEARLQKLQEQGLTSSELQEAQDAEAASSSGESIGEDDSDFTGTLPGLSRAGSIDVGGQAASAQAQQQTQQMQQQQKKAKKDDDKDLPTPVWSRTRTMPAKAAGVGRSSIGESPVEEQEQEDADDDDLGPTPVWTKVHSTPAGSANYKTPQPTFHLNKSGAMDDSVFGPNRSCMATMDQVKGRAMAAYSVPTGLPMMLLVPQTVLGNTPDVEQCKRMQASMLEAAMPDVYED